VRSPSGCWIYSEPERSGFHNAISHFSTHSYALVITLTGDKDALVIAENVLGWVKVRDIRRVSRL